MPLTSVFSASEAFTVMRFRHRFYDLCDEFKNYYRIFTDGSKESNRVSAAVVHRDNTKCVQLPDTASIFRAELYAFLLATDVVQRSKEKNFVIFPDSSSSLQSINGFNLDSDLIQKFLKNYTILSKNGKSIVLCWIPSHVVMKSRCSCKVSSLLICHSDEASCHRHVSSYN